MKIALFFTYDYSLSSWNQTGTLKKEIRIYEEIALKYDVKYIFFTYGDEKDLKLLPNHPSIEIFPIYKYFKKHNNKLIKFFYTFVIAFRLKKFISKVDLIQQHQLSGSWLSLIVKKISRIPYYMRTGYDTYLFSINLEQNYFIQQFYKILTYLCLKNSDAYSVTSKTDLKYLESLFKKNFDNLLLRPNWIEANYKDLSNRSNFRILSVGRLEKQKNYDFLINEFSNTNDRITIDIVGEGSLKNELIRLSDQKNVKVNFLGKVENEELMKLFHKYKFYISTSTFEGNPKTVLEAMSSGCIVIASNIPNHSELISNLKDGFLFDLKKNELIQTFDRVVTNNNLKTIAINSYKGVNLNHSLQVISEKYYEDYKRILNVI